MNYTTKKNIDLIVPVSLAIVAGVFIFRRSKDWRVILAVIAGAFIAAYILTTQITKNIVAQTPRTEKLPSDLSTADCKDYDGTALASAIYQDYDPGFFGSIFHTGSASTYSEVLALSNCQLVSLYNTWNSKYFGKTQLSLVGAFNYMDENGLLRSIANGSLIEAIQKRFLTLNIQ